MADHEDEGAQLEHLARHADAAAEEAGPMHQLRTLLRAKSEEGLPAAALDLAFSYRESGALGDDYFTTMFDDDLAPRDAPGEVVEVWESVAAMSNHPLVRARLHDLCFVARHGGVIEHVRAAIEAYLEIADRYPIDSDETLTKIHVALLATKAIERGLDLARRTRQDGLAAQVIDAGIRHAHRSVLDPEAGAGVVLGFLETLARDAATSDEVDHLLEQARKRYQGDVWNTLSTVKAQLERPRLDASGRAEMHRQAVEAFIAAADAADPMIAMIHLQDAANMATQYHLDDLSDRAVAKLQDLAGSDVGLVRHRVEVPLDEAKIEEWLAGITGQPTWQRAIEALLAAGAPTGHTEANKALADQMPEIAPLRSSMPTMHLGPDGLPRVRTAGDDPEHLLADIETRNLQITGPLWAEAQRRIGEKWAPLDEDEVTTFIGAHAHVPDDVAAAIGRTLNRHLAGDHEGAGFIALPKVERVVRELLLRLGETVYRPPTATTAGGYVGLGMLAASLQDRGLDASWGRFLIAFLAGQGGLNLRNEALHGTVVDLNEVHSTLILIAVLYVAIVVHADPPPNPSAEADEPGPPVT